MTGRLAGKVAVVTGAAQGIGWGLARAFAGEGAWVMLADQHEDAARARAAGGVRAPGPEADAVAIDGDEASTAAARRPSGS